MRRILAVLALGLALAGCAKINKAYQVLTTSTVSPTAVVVAGNSFDALEATATNYLTRPRCNGTNGPLCRDPGATAKIIPAIRAGRVARNNLEQFLVDHPGDLGAQGLYDTFTKTISTLQAVLALYK